MKRRGSCPGIVNMLPIFWVSRQSTPWTIRARSVSWVEDSLRLASYLGKKQSLLMSITSRSLKKAIISFLRRVSLWGRLPLILVLTMARMWSCWLWDSLAFWRISELRPFSNFWLNATFSSVSLRMLMGCSWVPVSRGRWAEGMSPWASWASCYSAFMRQCYQ